MPTTIPSPIPKKSAVIHGTRSQPGARSRPQPVRPGEGGACCVCSMTSVTSSHLIPASLGSPWPAHVPGAQACFFMTITGARISEWPSPQSSVQMSVFLPTFVGVIGRWVTRPGTASCFCRNSGTQKEWMTSSARKVELDLAALLEPELSSGHPKPPYCELPGNAGRTAAQSRRPGAGSPAASRSGRARWRSRSRSLWQTRSPAPQSGTDLDSRVTVDRRAVRIVVRPGAEFPDRVDDDRRDDGKDRDADRDLRTRRSSRSGPLPWTVEREATE